MQTVLKKPDGKRFRAKKNSLWQGAVKTFPGTGKEFHAIAE